MPITKAEFMGNILSTVVLKNNKIKFKVMLDESEAESLKGSMKNIHMFSENLCEEDARIVQKGAKGATKYFLLPKHFGYDMSKESKRHLAGKKFLCQKIDSPSKVIFIYTINRIGI